MTKKRNLNLFKFIIITSALATIPVEFKFNTISGSTLITLLIFFGAIYIFIENRIIPKKPLFLVFCLAVFCFLSILMYALNVDANSIVRANYLIVWPAALVVFVVFLNIDMLNIGYFNKMLNVLDAATILYIIVLFNILIYQGKNPAAAAAGTIFFSYAAASISKSKSKSKSKSFGAFYMTAILIINLLMGTRGALVSNIIILLLSVWLNYRQVMLKKSIFMVFVAILVAITLLLYIVWSLKYDVANVGDQALIAGDITINTSGRFYWWGLIIDSWLSAPWFGQGIPGPIEMLKTERWAHPHNDYLRLLHQIGIFGFAFWMSFYIGCVNIAFKLCKNKNLLPIQSKFFYTTFYSLIGFGVLMLTDNVIVYSYVILPVIVFAAVSVGFYYCCNGRSIGK